MRFTKLFIGIGLSCAMAFSSCENVIEVEPEFQRDVNTLFNNLDDYEFALTGAYARLRAVGYFGSGAQTTGTWSQLPDMMSDNLIQTEEDLANWANQTNWVYTSDEDDVAQGWLAAYRVITQTNIVLQNIEQFAADSPERVNRIRGQALALRAMAHFDLLRYWGVSYDRNSNELGVPYKESVDPEDLPARETVQETYNKIFRDLEEAEGLLGNVDRTINTGGSRNLIDQLVVQALLARINLYAKNYEAAEEYATLVITQRPLAMMGQFPGIWTDANSNEVIWSVNYNAGEGTATGGSFNGPSDRNRFRPSDELLATYDQARDVRYDTYFENRPFDEDFDRFVMVKFLSRGAAEDNLVNWKVLRTAEMYLIRAEARALKSGADMAGAVEDLNTLRRARIEGYSDVSLSGQALLDAIALERRKELVGEGHRWFDLKRTTRTVNRTDCGDIAANCTLGPDAREWAWPIPQGELDANPTLRDQQTPGYN